MRIPGTSLTAALDRLRPSAALAAARSARWAPVGLLIAACGGQEGAGPASSAPAPGAEDVARADLGPSPGSDGGRETVAAGLFCAEPTFDFGTIWEGVNVNHAFQLEARGDGPVRIEAVRTSCGCTIPRLERADGTAFVEGDTLDPGEQLVLDVQFASLHRTGSHDRPITVYGNVSESGRFQVHLTGVVEPRLQTSVEVAEIGRLLVGEGGRAEFEITSADGAPVTVLAPRASEMTPANGWPAGLELVLEPVEPDPRGRSPRWTATVAVEGGSDPAAFHWPLRLDIADDEGEYTGTGTTVYARWQRVRPLEASPPRFSLGFLRAGVLASAAVDLMAFAPGLDLAELDVSGASIQASIQGQGVSDHLSVVLRPADSADRAVLELVVDGLPADLSGPLQGQVVLDLGRADQESLTIAVDAIVSSG